MAQNYPKWPKNDARIYALYPQFFLTEKAIPQTFSPLECMLLPFRNTFFWQTRKTFLKEHDDAPDVKKEIRLY